MSVSCEYCVLLGRGLCIGLITHPEESYQVLWPECNHEASIIRQPWPTSAYCTIKEKKNVSTESFSLLECW